MIGLVADVIAAKKGNCSRTSSIMREERSMMQCTDRYKKKKPTAGRARKKKTAKKDS